MGGKISIAGRVPPLSRPDPVYADAGQRIDKKSPGEVKKLSRNKDTMRFTIDLMPISP
jgi:hypothetical protein